MKTKISKFIHVLRDVPPAKIIFLSAAKKFERPSRKYKKQQQKIIFNASAGYANVRSGWIVYCF